MTRPAAIAPAACLLAVVVLTWAGAGRAHAAKQLSFAVPARGGVYEVPVHPSFVTVFYFPSDVRHAYAHSQEHFTIHKSRSTITIHPQPGAKGAGNISVEIDAFRIGVVLTIVEDPADAAISVEFHAEETEEVRRRKLDQEIERRVALRTRELERRQRELDLRAVREARMIVARNIRRRLVTVPLRAAGRTDDYVVLRVRSMIWLGNDAYLEFELQNRGRTPYEIGAVEITVSGQNRAAEVALPHGLDTRLPGVVPPGTSERGVVCLPHAARFMDQRATLVVNEVDQPAREIRADFKVRQ